MPSGAIVAVMGDSAGATVQLAVPVPVCAPSVLVAVASTAYVPSAVRAGTVFVIETDVVACDASVTMDAENVVGQPAGSAEESVNDP